MITFLVGPTVSGKTVNDEIQCCFEINDQQYETEVALDIRILTLEQVFKVNFMNIRQLVWRLSWDIQTER